MESKENEALKTKDDDLYKLISEMFKSVRSSELKGIMFADKDGNIVEEIEFPRFNFSL